MAVQKDQRMGLCLGLNLNLVALLEQMKDWSSVVKMESQRVVEMDYLKVKHWDGQMDLSLVHCLVEKLDVLMEYLKVGSMGWKLAHLLVLH